LGGFDSDSEAASARPGHLHLGDVTTESSVPPFSSQTAFAPVEALRQTTSGLPSAL
jgi:hypothetical protein